jgi:WD40 repeat protein
MSVCDKRSNNAPKMLRFCLVLMTLFALCRTADQPVFAGEAAKSEYVFVKASQFKGKSIVHKESPDGKHSFKPVGQKGQILEAKSGKPVGPPLDAGVMWTEHHPRSFSCWTFSPDGKRLVTGSAFVEESGSKGGDRTDVGRIQIWDVATGKQTAVFNGRMGSVRSVAFSEDGKQVVYSAAPYEIDGP